MVLNTRCPCCDKGSVQSETHGVSHSSKAACSWLVPNTHPMWTSQTWRGVLAVCWPAKELGVGEESSCSTGHGSMGCALRCHSRMSSRQWLLLWKGKRVAEKSGAWLSIHRYRGMEGNTSLRGRKAFSLLLNSLYLQICFIYWGSRTVQEHAEEFIWFPMKCHAVVWSVAYAGRIKRFHCTGKTSYIWWYSKGA